MLSGVMSDVQFMLVLILSYCLTTCSLIWILWVYSLMSGAFLSLINLLLWVYDEVIIIISLLESTAGQRLPPTFFTHQMTVYSRLLQQNFPFNLLLVLCLPCLLPSLSCHSVVWWSNGHGDTVMIPTLTNGRDTELINLPEKWLWCKQNGWWK